MTRLRTGLVAAIGTALMSTALVGTAFAALPHRNAAQPHRATTGHITISDFGYSGDLTVTPGEHVVVTNKDGVPHTLTDKATHLFDTGRIAGGGGTGSFDAPKKAGSYPFGCTFHPDMMGTLIVRSAAPAKHTTALTTAKSVTVAKGKGVTLRTTLTDRSTKHVLARTKLSLLKRADAKHAFRTVASATTDAGGHAAIVARPTVSAQYEWRYAGDSRHAGAHSGVIKVAVRKG